MCFSFCLSVPTEHFKYTQYLYDSTLLKKYEVYFLDTEVLSKICVKNTTQFLPALITTCLFCKHCFSCWTSMWVLKPKENLQLIFLSDVNFEIIFCLCSYLGDMKIVKQKNVHA